MGDYYIIYGGKILLPINWQDDEYKGRILIHYTDVESCIKIFQEKSFLLQSVNKYESQIENIKNQNFLSTFFSMSFTFAFDNEKYMWKNYAKGDSGVRIEFHLNGLPEDLVDKSSDFELIIGNEILYVSPLYSQGTNHKKSDIYASTKFNKQEYKKTNETIKIDNELLGNFLPYNNEKYIFSRKKMRTDRASQ